MTSEEPTETTEYNPRRLSSVYWLVLFSSVLSGIALVTCVATYAQIRSTLDERARTGDSIKVATKQSNQLLETIEDCLNPSGKCAQRGQDSQKNAGTAITYCTLNLPASATRDIVSACIIRELTREIDR